MWIGKNSYEDQPLSPYIAGILNLSPDSFSDGQLRNEEEIVAAAVQLAEDGADLIDIGAESTRPGATLLSEEEELARLMSVLPAIRAAVSVPLSVDTYKPAVAEAALQAGVEQINDVHGLREADGSDSGMAAVVARHKAALVIMHNDFLKRDASERDENTVIDRVLLGLGQSVELALAAGVERERILLDPGLGFAKSSREDRLVMKQLNRLHTLGYPLYLGASRKSFIGNALQLPVDEREEATLVCSVLAGVERFCFVRVHDVKKNVRALKMLREIASA